MLKINPLFISILISFLFWSCSEKNVQNPNRIDLAIDLDVLNQTNLENSEKFRDRIVLVSQFLADTLTDTEEGQIIDLINESKLDSSINEFIRILDQTKLLKIMEIRWDEASLKHESGSWIERFFGKSTEPGLNQFLFTDLLCEVFRCRLLEEDAGRILLSVFIDEPFISAENTTAALQSIMMTVVHQTDKRKGINALSPAGKMLVMEVLTNHKGPASFQQSVINTRKNLEN